MTKVLVAGGAGFIGSNLSERLLARGDDVHIVDDLLTGRRQNVPDGASWREMDAADPAYIDAHAGDWDLVVHLAGASSLPLFDKDPLHLGQAVTAFQNSLEVARRSDAKVAFASTSSFYARCPKPYREDMGVWPATLYEASKLAMEQCAQAYAATHGIDTAALRFFSVYGPREQGKGRLANVVSQFLWSMRRDVPPVLYGDGTQTRDFTYVDDLLDGILTAVDHVSGFEAYNIGTGVEHTFNDVVAMLNKALGTDIEPTYVPNPVRNYVQETLADTSRLEALGWSAKVDLASGIQRLVEKEDPVDDGLLASIKV